MTNILKNFQIHDVVVDDDRIHVIGQDGTYAEVQKDDVINHHPGADVYEADRWCDRAKHRHVGAWELWGNGTDAGDPVNMVCEVFNLLPKQWFDADCEPLKIAEPC